jgi:hypothetical protein
VKATDVHSRNALKTILLVTGTALVTVIATLGIQYGRGAFTPRTRQAEVAARGVLVMPFDLEQTTHVFQPLDDGGLQMVTAKDPSNHAQIALIQAHLREESDKFRRGDFSDPTKIHGANMPGLAELQAGAGYIEIDYTTLPNGAQIRYTTKDPALVMAIHHWFMAQLSDHGHHASSH